MTDKKQAFLILGAPRSGTSLVSHILYKMGVNFGKFENFLDTKIYTYNPIFFELKWVLDFNNKIIHHLGGIWGQNDILPLENDFNNEQILQLIPLIKNNIKSEWEETKVIGIKDPRISITFPLWEQILTSMGYQIKIICVYRHPFGNVASNYQLNYQSLDFNLRFWLQHNLGIAYFTKNYAKYLISYDKLMKNSHSEITKMATHFQLLSNLSSDTFSVISKDYYHYVFNDELTHNFIVDQCYESFQKNRILDPHYYLIYRDICLSYQETLKEKEKRIQEYQEKWEILNLEIQKITQEKEEYLTIIAEMKNSKFWRLRESWIKLKKSINLPNKGE